jgi:SAM-dependent methyltransferase
LSDRNSEQWKSRSRSFGSVAANYDRYRPTYPDALFEHLLSIAPGRRVVDVGSGTGRAAIGFASRGAQVVGVEHDADMAAVAVQRRRDFDLTMVVSRFEDFHGESGTFDLITCAQAWHWIDHEKGVAQADRLLVPNGVLAIWWNRPAHFDGPVWEAIQDVYVLEVPDLDRRKHLRDRNYGAPVPEPANELGNWKSTVYEWSQVYSAADYVGFLGTHSDHILLEPEIRERLFCGVHQAIDEHGGSVDYPRRTLLYTATKTAAVKGQWPFAVLPKD